MLQEAIDNYIVTLSAKEMGGSVSNRNTIMAYRNDLYQLCTYLSDRKLVDWSLVTHDHLASYMLMMRDGQAYRPTTIARKLAALKSFFRYMRISQQISIDPLENVEAPRIHKDLPQFLNDEQINSLFLHIEADTFGGQRDLAMLHMLYATGMRSSELVSLNIGDFDAALATVRCLCRSGSEEKVRFLPLPLVAIEATAKYMQSVRPRLMRYTDEQALFLNHHGERLTRQGFWLIIKGYARLAGITNITPHMLRHSFAILMLREGMELRSVQALLGHAHISTTQVYRQLVASQLARS